MQLVIDIGNTNKKFAVFHKGKLKSLTLIHTLNLSNVRKFISSHPGITHCILSTVTSCSSSVKKYLENKFVFIELDEKTPVPVKVRYKTPETLGKDRLAAAVAAYHRFPSHPVLVINAGTCITFDFINAKGEYLGGSISPGIQMRFRALHTFTGRLPLISGNASSPLTGRNTRESILSGVLNGTVCELEGMISEYAGKYDALKVIISGGDMKRLDKKLKIKTFAVPNIVIEGLYQILELNAGKDF